MVQGRDNKRKRMGYKDSLLKSFVDWITGNKARSLDSL
jgi:hypothetical protein